MKTKVLARIVWAHTRNVLRVLAVVGAIVGVGILLRAWAYYLHDTFHFHWLDITMSMFGGSLVGGFASLVFADSILGYFRNVRKQAEQEVEREQLATTSDRETLLRGAGK